MELKNKEIKKLFDYVAPYFDLFSLPSAMTEFMACDEAIEGEIAAVKAELTDANQRLNNERKHGEDLADVNGQLASENVDLKAKVTLLETSRITWRSRAQHAEKEIEDLNKKISDLEEENANLRVTPPDVNAIEALKKENSDLENELTKAKRLEKIYHGRAVDLYEENDRLRGVVDTLEKEISALKKKIHELEQETTDDAIRIKSLERANSVLRSNNGILWSKMEEADIPKHPKCPWHGDGNAMTGAQTCCESLAETIEFQNKKIEELEAEKARLKEAYDIHETTIKKENVDLSPDHEFEFGDKVFVPWSDIPYMYIKTSLMYNPRTERLVYVGKDQHLKWTGEKFEIK